MEDDFVRETQPGGDLAQPPRKPPTAVAVATPAPGPSGSATTRRTAPSSWFAAMVTQTLDIVDVLGDVVAEALHLRPRA